MSDGGFLNSEAERPEPGVESVAAAEGEPRSSDERETPAPAPVEVAPQPAAVEVPEPVAVEAPAPAVHTPESLAQELSSVMTGQQAPEAAIEQNPDTFLEGEGAVSNERAEAGGGAAGAVATPTDDQRPTINDQKDEVVVEVEKILEAGLGEYYNEMPEAAKQRFHAKGRQVAVQIAAMVRQLKLQVKQALHLIREWLQTIPGVNKFFLEQESKIKTDQLMILENDRRAASLSPA
jgi:hypothetical protein